MIRDRFTKQTAKLLVVMAIIAACDLQMPTFAASFQGIPGTTSATAISPNGLYVTGFGYSWSRNTGTVHLPGISSFPDLVPGDGRGVSNDGRAIVGRTPGSAEGGGSDGAIWYDGSVFNTPNTLAEIEVWAVSGDGTKAVGRSRYRTGALKGVEGATVWNLQGAGVPPLVQYDTWGFLAPGTQLGNGYVRAPDISEDGSRILANTAQESRIIGNGTDLGTLSGLTHIATKMSPDGNLLAGSYGGRRYDFAVGDWVVEPAYGFLYDTSRGTQASVAFSAWENAAIGGISNTGRVVGQMSSSGSSPSAFYWDDGLSEAIDMKDYLMQQPWIASSLQGWTLTSATDISADGRTIVGDGVNPQGQQQAWIAGLNSTHVLSVGVRDDRPNPDPKKIQGHGGDISAQLVRDAFRALPSIGDANSQALLLNTASSESNRSLLVASIRAMESNVAPDDTFIFYLNAHGFWDPSGTELPVNAEDPSGGRTITTGNERVLLSRTSDAATIPELVANEDNISDDELASLFATEKWNAVNKLFVIDTCYANGFWGSQLSEDLQSLSKSSILAASSEADVSYAQRYSNSGYAVGNLGQAMIRALGHLQNQDSISLSDLVEQTRIEGKAFVGQEGFIQDLAAYWSNGMTSRFEIESSSTADFDFLLVGNGTNVPEPGAVSIVAAALLAAAHVRRRSAINQFV